jgi:hypothetical protein
MNSSLALAPSTSPGRSSLTPFATPPADPYRALVTRLSRASVKKHFDAYADIAWDDDAFRIDPQDPRWELPGRDPLGATAWYQSLPPAERARLGLAVVAEQMKIGVAFESVLQRGLLELTGTLPNGSDEYRYAYHELIEEGQHSLMFQEFVNRSGTDVPAMSGFMAWMASRIPKLGRTFPELFFIYVLGGETPIDLVQRAELARGDAVHPLQRRIMQIHVTEEARHVCFAEHYLEQHAPELGALRLAKLRVMTPFILSETARLILKPQQPLLDRLQVPREVVREAYGTSETYRRLVSDGVAPIRELCMKLGIVTPALVPLWKTLGVWSTGPARKALTC